MKTDSRLVIDVKKLLCAAHAAVAGVLFCALAGTLSCVAQTPPVVIPYTINSIAGTLSLIHI